MNGKVRFELSTARAAAGAAWIAAVAGTGVALGCQPAMRGGSEMARELIPRGELVASFTVAQCTGEARSRQGLVLDYVRGTDRKPLLVERSAGRSWLVVTNVFADGDELVFQAVRLGAEPRQLLEYRFAAAADRAGRHGVTSAFTELDSQGGGFRAFATSWSASCALVRVDSVSGAPLAGPAEGAGARRPAAVAPAGSGSGSGAAVTPEAGARAYRVGDRVAVELGGRVVGATVLQAPGQDYFVHYDGTPEGAGEWVKASRIRERLR
jgi:hypothetical protein